MAYTNNSGQVRIGVRAPGVAPVVSTSTLLTSLYSVWNGDTLGTTLDSSIFGAWNGDASNNLTVKNAWNANGDLVDSKSGVNGIISVPSGASYVTGSTMSFGSGKVGSNSFLMGAGKFVSLPAGSFQFTGDFSVSFWVYLPSNITSSTNYNNIGIPLVNAFDNSSGWTTYRGWSIGWYGNELSFYIYMGNTTNLYGIITTLNADNQWHHITVVRKLGQQGKIYIDGNLSTLRVDARGSGSSTSVINYNTNNISYIGASYYGFSQPYYNVPTINYKIDAVQTWEVELNQTAVTELYNSGNGQEYPFTVSNALIPSTNDSVGTNHGTLVNGTTFTTGKIGNAFSFDGVNDYVTMGMNAGNFGSNSFSISGWFYPNVGNVLQMLVAKGTTTATNKGFNVAIDNRYNSNQRGLSFGLVGNNSNYQNITTTNQYNIGGWNHFIVIWDSVNKTMKIYLNGVQATTTTTLSGGSGASGISDISNTSTELLLGGRTDNTLYFNGKLDGITTWTKALSDDEVVQLYNAGNGTQYPFGSQTLPSVANQFGVDNGTLMNGCTFTDGKIGKAFTFDGVNDFVLLPTNAMRFTGDFSYSFFVSLGSISGDQTILSCENYLSNENGDRGYVIYFNNGVLKFGGWYNSSILFSSLSTTTVTANTWYHFVVIKTTSQVKIYMNGVLQTTTNFTGTLAYNSVVYPAIGVQYKQNNVNNANYSYISAGSKIDALNAWSKSLTQAEITELYNSGNGKQITATPIVTNGLVLNLDASRTSSYPNAGTTWTDISGNGNNGTLTNGPVFGTASGGVITFDGIDDYVSVGNKTLNITNSVTINAWVYLNTSNDYRTIFSYGGYITGGFLLQRHGEVGNKLRFAYNGSGLYDGPTFTTTGQWVNLVVVATQGQPVNFYVNTIKTSSSNTLTLFSPSTTNTIDIARRTDTISQYIDGKISNIQVYNRVLTDTEITQNFNATKTRFGL